MSDLDKYRKEQMEDTEFRQYCKEREPEADISKAIVGARIKAGLTQKELAKLSGYTQADISRLESCEGNPSLKKLKRVTKALNMQLRICFTPLDDEFIDKKN